MGRQAEGEATLWASVIIQEKLTADFPDVPAHKIALAGGYYNFGLFANTRREYEPAGDLYSKAIDVLQAGFGTQPPAGAGRQILLNSFDGRAWALGKLKRYADARRDWEKALEFDDGSRRPRLIIGRSDCLVRLGDHAKAVADIDALLPTLKSASQLYDAACILAVASDAAKDDTAAAKRLAIRAVATLRQAVGQGYSNIPHLLRDADLDSLRGRTDYLDFQWDLAETPPRRPPQSAAGART